MVVDPVSSSGNPFFEVRCSRYPYHFWYVSRAKAALCCRGPLNKTSAAEMVSLHFLDFPKPYLTDGSHVWIRTLEFLKPHVHLFTGVRFPSNTLKTFGFGNNVPSISHRPRLLCGHLVSQLLHNTFIHGVDRLRYPLVIPHADFALLVPS